MTAHPSFWARRRAGVQAEAEADLRAEDAARIAAVEADLAQQDDETLLQRMGLPDPDEMAAGDDFAAFMAREVPAHLRNRALRTLWRSNPVLACVDGLNEYDDDYRAAMLSGGPIQTAYQVGKGMMAHIKEMERKHEEAEREADAPPEMPQTPQTPQTPQIDAPPPEEIVAEPVEMAFAPPPEDAALDAPVPRRMRFHFDEADT